MFRLSMKATPQEVNNMKQLHGLPCMGQPWLLLYIAFDLLLWPGIIIGCVE
jgi:hypothetical protein